MYRLRYYFPLSILFTLYNALILPYLSYCVTVWGNSSQMKLDSLFKLQKKCVRICTGSHYLSHTAPLFYKLKTLNIFDLYKYHIALIAFLYFKGLLPNTISQYFCVNNQIHNHNTRSSNLIHLWKVQSTLSQKSVRYNLPVIWNSLPSSVIQSKTLSQFKRALKNYLLPCHVQALLCYHFTSVFIRYSCTCCT